jgi:hypothetical protein
MHPAWRSNYIHKQGNTRHALSQTEKGLMTDPGLNQRLRQRSRRAGFMIGISMALTIVVCVAGFSFIYAALDDTIGDFISRDVPDPVIPTQEPTEPAVAEDNEGDTSEEPAPTNAPETEPTGPPADEAEETAESDEFVPDYQSSSNASLNFRSEPSTSGEETTIIQTLPVETPLQFMNETQPSDNPAEDGEEGWMLFRLEDGTEGWLRAIDVNEFEP